jgi:hypothetical protein
MMSESEISDLEQQIASGRLSKSYPPGGRITKEFGDRRELLLDEEQEEDEEEEGVEVEVEEEEQDEEEGEEVVVEEEEDDRNEDGEDIDRQGASTEYQDLIEDEAKWHGIKRQQENYQEDDQEEEEQQHLCGSSSMPSIVNRQSGNCAAEGYWGPGYVTADFWHSEYPIGEEMMEEGWEEADGSFPTAAGHCPPNMHRSLTVQSEFHGGGGGRRRMLPLRPNQIDLRGGEGMRRKQTPKGNKGK